MMSDLHSDVLNGQQLIMSAVWR